MFRALMNFMKAKRVLPKISDTERQALEAGTVWIDGDFFAGSPDFKRILKEPYHKLSAEEQSFLDGPVEELLGMIDQYEVNKSRKVPEEVVNFLKKNGFMGLLIPKKYGGLEFSSLAISTIIHKVMPHSSIVGVMIVIPNSLGAAELIIHYGTSEQKDEYLPKLASGAYIPCFALTESTAGSDAAAMKSEGTLFKDKDGNIKIQVNFEKRYISMAPVSNLISLACKLKDPEHLLSSKGDIGITVLLIPKGAPGLEIGEHHLPIGDPFYNGPLKGNGVVVPVESIIGGPDYAGKGWKMLMEQLGGGRAISLPAGAVGAMKNVAAATGAYSQIRSQFNIPLCKMEGIVEKTAKMAALTYAFDALRIFSCSAVDEGEQPPVVSAVLKAYSTEAARELLIDAVDIFGGAGVMQGPRNILGRGYAAAPIGITVEGANIMTRTLIIFGQGATRCHPYAYHLIKAVEEENANEFRSMLISWIGNFFAGIVKKSFHTITRGLFISSPVNGPTAVYYRHIGWAASRFAMLTNLAIFTLGGKLKAAGSLTGRFADALAWQLIAVSALRRFEEEGRKKEDLPLVQYACEYSLNQVQRAFEGIYRNFDVPVIGGWMRSVGSWLLRLNPVGLPPSDRLSAKAGEALQEFDARFNRIIHEIFIPDPKDKGLGQLLSTFKLMSEAKAISEKIAKAQRARKLSRGMADEIREEALSKGIINSAEAEKMEALNTARMQAIEVDSFTPAEFFQEDAVKIAPGFEDQLEKDEIKYALVESEKRDLTVVSKKKG